MLMSPYPMAWRGGGNPTGVINKFLQTPNGQALSPYQQAALQRRAAGPLGRPGQDQSLLQPGFPAGPGMDMFGGQPPAPMGMQGMQPPGDQPPIQFGGNGIPKMMYQKGWRVGRDGRWYAPGTLPQNGYQAF